MTLLLLIKLVMMGIGKSPSHLQGTTFSVVDVVLNIDVLGVDLAELASSLWSLKYH